ncbi:MAG TPA: glycosyl hydrolase, partial [Acidimicrobiia bacterium]|nr:glycosyl hydrolase [Acidimicrobiia bacterium]
WAGSDDGLVHVSRDGGENWTDVTPADLPEWSFVRTVEPSPHQEGTVYLAATRYKLDDNTPYLFRTDDYGSTWVSISGEGDHVIPDDDYIRVIRADPAREGLLYVGTETGIYVSTDDGATWDRWESGIPVTPVYDLTVKGTDLVVATHGRSFWILDDLTPLHQLVDDAATTETRLFQPRRAWRLLPDLFSQWIKNEGKDYWVSLGKQATFIAEKDETGQVRRIFHDAGEAAPVGATITYFLSEADAEREVTLEFSDSDGNVVRRLGTKPDDYDDLEEDEKAHQAGPWITAKPGLNRFLWDLRHAGATRVLGNKLTGAADTGPLVVPGTYRVKLIVGSGDDTTSSSESFEVVNDPRVDVSQESLQSQLGALLEIRDKISQAHQTIIDIRSITAQLDVWSKRSDLSEELRSLAETLRERLVAAEGELIKPGKHDDMFGGQEPARLNQKLTSVISVISSADAPPTRQALELADKYSEEIDEHLDEVRRIVADDLAAFNEAMAEAGLPAVEVLEHAG